MELVREKGKVGDGRVGFVLGDNLFGIDPVDSGGDFIYFKYDVGASMLDVRVKFNMIVAGNVAGLTAVCKINNIKYSIDYLFEHIVRYSWKSVHHWILTVSFIQHLKLFMV